MLEKRAQYIIVVLAALCSRLNLWPPFYYLTAETEERLNVVTNGLSSAWAKRVPSIIKKIGGALVVAKR